MRSISASRSVGGSAPRPSSPAASSSSANSGLPSQRAKSRVEQVLARARAEDVGELLGQLGARRAARARCGGRRVALELGEQRPQRVAAVQLVGPVAGDDQHRSRCRAWPRGRPGTRASSGRPSAGPRSPAAARSSPASGSSSSSRRVEEARLGRRSRPSALRRAAPRPGSDVRERRSRRAAGERLQSGVAGAGERAQGGDDRRVGQLALAQLDALAADHAHAARARRPHRARRAGASCRRPTRRPRTRSTDAPVGHPSM